MYEYNGKLYLDTDDVDVAIVKEIGGNYNHIPADETAEFELIWHDDVEKLNAHKWETFKAYCEQEGLNPSHDKVVEEYMRKVS